ncbi:MAG: hypothetical protein LUI87_08095 [Lachnospiraceae bacterium]|nr:hypothetical protein [Lachnospiraceae bacterium]
MMFKSYYGETVAVVLSIAMGGIMALVSVFVEGLDLNFSILFRTWSMITLVIMAASILFPYTQWSEALTSKTGLKKGGIFYKLVDNILPSLILNTCSTLVVSAANIFYNESIPAEAQLGEWLQGVAHSWPIMFVASYFASFAAVALGKWVAGKYCDK